MKSNLKSLALVVGLVVSVAAAAEEYTCPQIEGRFTQDQQILDPTSKAEWTFWADQSPQSVQLDHKPWPTQKAKNKKAGSTIICTAGGAKGPWYGLWHFVESKKCHASGGGKFQCD